MSNLPFGANNQPIKTSEIIPNQTYQNSWYCNVDPSQVYSPTNTSPQRVKLFLGGWLPVYNHDLCRLQIWHDWNEYIQFFSGDIPFCNFRHELFIKKRQATEINRFLAHPVAPIMWMKSHFGKTKSCNYTHAGTWRMPWLQINETIKSFNRSILGFLTILISVQYV